MPIYRESDCVAFFRNRDPFAEFSNMCGGFPIEYGGRVWKSSEGLYQALRYPGRHDIHEAINSASNAFMAKKVAYHYIGETRPDWQEVKVDTMDKVVSLKTAQHFTKISEVLGRAGNRDIVEKSNRDAFWGAIPDGDGNLVGENVLGLVWMLRREEIATGVVVGEFTLDL